MSGKSEKAAVKRNSPAYEIWKRFKKNKAAMLGLAIFSVMVILAVFADVICDYDTQVIAQRGPLVWNGRLRPGYLCQGSPWGQDLHCHRAGCHGRQRLYQRDPGVDRRLLRRPRGQCYHACAGYLSGNPG